MVSGKKIKFLRTNNGWSQEQLAEITGLGLRTIQRIEKEGNCSLESKLALSSAFSTSPNELHDEKEQSISLKKGINWDGMIGLSISFGLIFAMFFVTGTPKYYLDHWSILLVILLPLGLSCVSSGVKNALTVYKNISWLFVIPQKIKPLPKLIPCIRRIIFYSYVSGVLGAILSLIAIFSNITPEESSFWPAMAIALISPLHAILFSELILRPLKHKYEQVFYLSQYD